MKKFFIHVLILTLLLFSIIAGVNYYIDPSFILHRGKFEIAIANNIVQDYSVAVYSNFNERLFQRYVIQKLEYMPDGIILGNSQIMTVFPSSMGFEKGYNHGVSGGDIYDFIGILKEYKYWHKQYPENIVLAIDPWMFNENDQDLRDVEFSIPVEKKNIFSTELFSFTYFKASVDLRRSASSRINNIEVFKDFNVAKKHPGTVVFFDETRKYADDFLQTKRDITLEIEDVIETETIRGAQNFHELSPKIQVDFENLIEELQKHNVTISFIFVPRPPLLWNYIQSNEQYQMFNEADQYLHQLASQNNINIVGSYNPYEVNAKNTDYFDAFHSMPEFINQMLIEQSTKNIK